MEAGSLARGVVAGYQLLRELGREELALRLTVQFNTLSNPMALDQLRRSGSSWAGPSTDGSSSFYFYALIFAMWVFHV